MKTLPRCACAVLLLCAWPCVGQILAPVADAYVRDGAYANNNFGADTTLVIKNDAPGYNRNAYVKFALPNVGSSGSARLRLYARRSGSSLDLEIHSVAETNWAERQITWSNAPPRGTRLAARRIDSSSWKWYEFDVSAHVRAEQAAGRTTATFRLQCPHESDTMIYAASREAGANQPTLALVGNAPPVVGLRSDIAAPDGLSSNTLVLNATASDPDGQVVRVDFWVNGATLVSLTNSPYTCTWSNVPPGQYEIVAVAVDNLGLQAASTPVTMVVPASVRVEGDGLAGAWNFDEGAGSFSADLSGGLRHAVIGSSARWAEGLAGHAVEGGEISVPNTNQLLPRTGGGFTLSMWVKPQAIPPGWSALAGSGDNSARGWRFGIARDANQTNLVFWSTEHGGTLEARAPGVLSTGQWCHLAITFDGAVGKIFRNGVAAGEGYGGIVASTSSVQVAAMAGLQTFPGAIDELRLYRRGLEPHEIGPLGEVSLVTVLQGMATNIAFNGHVAPGRQPQYQIVAPGPTNGFLKSLTSTQVMYTPNGSYKGPDAFQYTVADGTFTSAPVTVVISVVTPHYISPGGGALLQDGRTPERAWAGTPVAALDAIIRTNNWYDCFFYSEGVFEMSGASYGVRRTSNWGCKHIGSGPGTVLRYVNAFDEVNDDTLFNAAICGLGARTDDFELANLTIDCNASGNPKMVRGLPYVVTVPLGGPKVIDTIRIVWDRSRLANTTYELGHARDFGVVARDAATTEYVLIHTNSAGVGGADGVETITGFQPFAADEVRLILGARGHIGTNRVGFYGIRELEILSGGTNVALNQPLSASDIPQHDKYFEWAGVSYLPARAVDGDYTTQWASRSQGMVGAVFMTGSNLRFTNLHIVNFGTSQGREAFPFTITDTCYVSTTNQLGNILVENVTVRSPARNNGDGCTALMLFATKRSTMTNAVMRNCRVAGLREDFTYSQAFSTHHLENSYAMRCSVGWYAEPASVNDDIGPVLIRSNQFLRCDLGIVVQFHVGVQFSSILAEGNHFFHDNTHPSWAFLCVEHGQNSTTNIILNRNTVSRAAGPSQVEASSGGVFLQSIWHALVGNHGFEIATNYLSFVNTLAPPGARRAFFANTNAIGALVPVGEYSSGVILTNAQWPY